MPDPADRASRTQRRAERIENFLALHEAHHVTQLRTLIECHTCNQDVQIQDGGTVNEPDDPQGG